jgi:hypothetical protein
LKPEREREREVPARERGRGRERERKREREREIKRERETGRTPGRGPVRLSSSGPGQRGGLYFGGRGEDI